MMKRIMACLMAAICLLTAFAFAEGASMKVVNVNEAVNLRKGPSTDTESLAKVPVGTVVTDCVKVDRSEWYSVNYNGVAGYIRGDKLQLVEAAAEPVAEAPAAAEGEILQPAAEAQPEPAAQSAVAEGTPLLPTGAAQEEAEPAPAVEEVIDAPVASIDQPTEYNDDFTILDTMVGGVRVIARQIYQEKNEYMMVVGLDGSNNTLWMKETVTDAITELMQTDVFIGGTQDAPLVMLYNACKGLSAIDPATGDVIWELAKSTIDLGGSISYVVDGNGVAYIGGYYGPDPVAIDAFGNVMWQASSGSDGATWLYRMELTDAGVACAYGSMANENTGTIVYDTATGAVVDVIYD